MLCSRLICCSVCVCICSRNVQAMRKLLLDLWDETCPLSTVPGTVGEISQVDSFGQICFGNNIATFEVLHLFPFFVSFPFQAIESYLSQLRWCLNIEHLRKWPLLALAADKLSFCLTPEEDGTQWWMERQMNWPIQTLPLSKLETCLKG